MLTILEFLLILALNFIALGASGLIAWFYLRKEIAYTIDGFLELFTGTVTDPKVSRAMTILGKESGRVRAQEATTDALATRVLSGPALQGLKMAAKAALNIDVDEFIEEYGAVETLNGLKSLGDALNIDFTGLLTGGIGKGLNSPLPSGKTSGEYLKG